MAGTSLLALLDDIATILDDVSILTKVAAKKTAGVLGDDLALNAQQVTGVVSDREIPVVLAVAKGSAINKAILVPAALAISTFVPWLVTPLLMIGGAFLCFEGFEKVFHKIFHAKEEEQEEEALVDAFEDENVDMVAFEKEKIKGAVRTDFILSAEIIVISLGTVADVDFMTRIGVLIAIAVLMTVGVYGLVAAIVKLDDLGLHMARQKRAATVKTGELILAAAPIMMKGLGVVGTIAMFLVGGGIIAHGVPFLATVTHDIAHAAGSLDGIVQTLLDGVVGIVVGGVVLALLTAVKKIVSLIRNKTPEP